MRNIISEYRSIARIIRDHAKLIRELTAAKALLKFCQENKVYPKDYQAELDMALGNPQIQAMANEYDDLASTLEKAAYSDKVPSIS